MPPLALALRTYARYAAPLTLLAVVIYAPLLAYGVLSPAPAELGPAWRMVMVAWTAASTAWIVQYLLVGAAAPLAHGLADGAPLSQLAALRAGIAGVARAVLPILIVIAAVAMGALALVIPGLVLGVLLSLTAASPRSGLAAPMLDSVARVRANAKLAILAVVAILAVDLALVGIPFAITLGPLSPRPTPEELAAAQRLLQLAAIGLPVISPFAACLLAAVATARRTA